MYRLHKARRVRVLSVGLSDKPKQTKVKFSKENIKCCIEIFKIKFWKVHAVGNLTSNMKKI